MCRQKLGQSSTEEACSDEDRNIPEPSQESHSPAVVRYVASNSWPEARAQYIEKFTSTLWF